tara:strand:+ start:106 stop:630 length:525 start_codon:yes stop_codon:yes gene_type:complete
MPKPNRKPRYLINENIRFPEVRLINVNNEPEGLVKTHHARNMAMEHQLDLVCISQEANPPVCKIIDFNKWQYQEQQRNKESARKQRANRIETKEFQFRLTIDKHDKDVKIKNICKHMTKGSHIRCIVQMRGRERSNTQYAKEFLESILQDIGEHGIVAPINVTGNKVIVVIKKD